MDRRKQEFDATICLRAHSEFSEDGSATIRQLVQRASDVGCAALAVTDVSVMNGAFELQSQARNVGVKPIFGLDLPIRAENPNTPIDEPKVRWDVITLLAENEVGLKRLFALSSESAALPAGTALPFKRLAASCRGLTAIAGGADLPPWELALARDQTNAGSYLEMLKDTFGSEHLCVGIPALGEQRGEQARRLVDLARTHSLKIVNGHVVRFARPVDLRGHQTYMGFRDQATPATTAEDFMLDSDAARRAFSEWPEVFETARDIAERCDAEIPLQPTRIPPFPAEEGEDSVAMLRRIATGGLLASYGDPVPAQARRRLELELGVIEATGFSDYFLIVWDFVKYAREKGVSIGPGRGSAAGSIVSFSLGITSIDPIEHDLLFERFFNLNSESPPDIDIDLSVRGRDLVIQYLAEKYGSESVSQIATYGRIGPHRALTLASEGCGHGSDAGDDLARMVPEPVLGRAPTIADCLRDDQPLRKAYDSDAETAEIIDTARRLEAKISSKTIHAAALAISAGRMETYVPRALFRIIDSTGGSFRSSNTPLVTQFPLRAIQELGLLTMDLLVLRDLDVIEDAISIIRRSRQVGFEIADIAIDDPVTFDMLSRGETIGVFQLGSSGMREAMRSVVPTEFDDIIVLTSLYRPGAMSEIPKYAAGKANPESIEYVDERLKSITKSTHGCLIYQEQLMAIAIEFAGFSPSEANELRRHIGRKFRERMVETKAKFVKGVTSFGDDPEFANYLWEICVAASDYAYNKSHAACYALISYRSAYLKANYPAEFDEALKLNHL